MANSGSVTETSRTPRETAHFLFLNIGHFIDHFFILIFATVAALVLTKEWGLSYAQLIPYATPGFIAFGLCSLPAGWLADKWSRRGMLAVFFIGMGASCLLASTTQTPFAMSMALLLLGMFGAIYHPVGIPLVIEASSKKGMAIAVNGIFGNLGIGAAALVTGMFIDLSGWRSAFVWPGIASIALGIVYWWMFLRETPDRPKTSGPKTAAAPEQSLQKSRMMLVIAIIFTTTAFGGLVFQSTTFALPKVFAERLGEVTNTATGVGWYAFIVLAIAAVGQLIVGALIDRFSARYVFMGVAACQALFFAMMPSLDGTLAIAVSIGFMIAVFGQIPINDVLLGRFTNSEWRSRIFAARYLVTFSAMALAVPMISWLYKSGGFDRLFWTLCIFACIIFTTVLFLPNFKPTLKQPEASAPAE